jgi:CRP-like cAMP-binding protein
VLSRLLTTEYRRLEPYFENVPLIFGETIYKSKDEIDYVYFPEGGVLSVVTNDADKPIEIGLIGSEGLAGLPLFLGVRVSTNDVIVQGEGTALRIAAKQALAEFKRGEAFHDQVLLFAHDVFLQVSQVTSCNRHHDVEQRLSRWLLMMRDRMPHDTLPLKQEFLSWMLGVRNQAVSQAAKGLQDSNAIKYSRGVITIVNRLKLEKKACPCYRLMKMRTDGHFGAGESLPV